MTWDSTSDARRTGLGDRRGEGRRGQRPHRLARPDDRRRQPSADRDARQPGRSGTRHVRADDDGLGRHDAGHVRAQPCRRRNAGRRSRSTTRRRSPRASTRLCSRTALYDLHAIATDGATAVTSNVVTTRVDNTPPTGAVTAPLAGATIGGPSVTLRANPADGGSGVATVAVPRRRHAGRHVCVAAVDVCLGPVLDPERSTHDRRGRDRRSGQLDHHARRARHGRLDSADRDAHRSRRHRSPARVDARTRPRPTPTRRASTSSISPAGSGAWTTSQPTRRLRRTPTTFDTTTVSDGLYDFRAIARDASATLSAPSVVAAGASTTPPPSFVSADPGRRLDDRAAQARSSVTASEALVRRHRRDARRRRDRRAGDLRRDRDVRHRPARRRPAHARRHARRSRRQDGGLHDALHDRQRAAARRLAVRRDERAPGVTRRCARPTAARRSRCAAAYSSSTDHLVLRIDPDPPASTAAASATAHSSTTSPATGR